MKIVEIRKLRFRRDLYLFGHRIASFLRLQNILEEIHRCVSWLVAYRSMRQHGIGLSADCQPQWSEHHEIVEMPVGDLKRFWIDRPVFLEETALVRYLQTGDDSVIRDYYEQLRARYGGDASAVDIGVVESRRIFDSVRGLDYDPSICCIVVNEQNVILDGYHRSAAILAKHGRNHSVKVLRLLPDCR